FAEVPIVIESVGLTVPVPVGSKSEQTSVGDRSSVKIRASDLSWQITIQTPRIKDELATPREILEDLVVGLMEQSGVVYDATSGSGMDVLDPEGTKPRPVDAKAPRKPRLAGYKGAIVEPMSKVSTVGGVEAERIYIKLPPEDPAKATPLVRGYVVFKSSPTQLISFELVTPEAEFKKTRKLFETILAASSVEDSTVQNAERRAAIEAGVKVFENLDRAAMEEVLATANNQWRRLYRPAATGHASDDTEIGYQRITTRIGPGPVDSPINSNGYVVQIDARVLLEQNVICDTRGVYFLSLDREREHWTVTSTFRDTNPDKAKRAAPTTVRELGAREAKSLSVRNEGDREANEQVRATIEGAGYISQVEALVLPQILVRSRISANFAFYSYRSKPQQIQFRRDDVRQPADQPGVWVISSKINRFGAEQTITLNEKGEVVHIEFPDGNRAERTTLAELTRLWKDKGLPTD
ncbi:MAG: hypothetical protein ACOYN0_15190, partial [Phycisphaerales bacterium]